MSLYSEEFLVEILLSSVREVKSTISSVNAARRHAQEQLTIKKVRSSAKAQLRVCILASTKKIDPSWKLCVQESNSVAAAQVKINKQSGFQGMNSQHVSLSHARDVTVREETQTFQLMSGMRSSVRRFFNRRNNRSAKDSSKLVCFGPGHSQPMHSYRSINQINYLWKNKTCSYLYFTGTIRPKLTIVTINLWCILFLSCYSSSITTSIML